MKWLFLKRSQAITNSIRREFLNTNIEGRGTTACPKWPPQDGWEAEAAVEKHQQWRISHFTDCPQVSRPQINHIFHSFLFALGISTSWTTLRWRHCIRFIGIEYKTNQLFLDSTDICELHASHFSQASQFTIIISVQAQLRLLSSLILIYKISGTTFVCLDTHGVVYLITWNIYDKYTYYTYTTNFALPLSPIGPRKPTISSALIKLLAAKFWVVIYQTVCKLWRKVFIFISK